MNVVLVIIDSLRKDHVGAYGNGWIQTPNLDALARESLVFDRAYPECMPTIPTRRAIYTGRRTFPFRDYSAEENNSTLTYGWLPIPKEQTTLAEILNDRGCETMLVTDTYHQFKPAMNFHRGFETFQFVRGQETDRYKPYWTVPPERMQQYLPIEEVRTRHHLGNTADRKTEEDWFAPQVFRGAISLLETLRDRQPFFMTIDVFDPHEPWDAPKEYVDLYDDPYDGPEPFCPRYGDAGYLTEHQIERMRALYAAEVTLVDRWLGRFLDTLSETKLADETLVVLLSDHGHLLGERGLTGKPHEGLWPELTDIPFMLRHPEGKRAGDRSDFFASTHDLLPTILGTLGVGVPAQAEGQDLSRLFDGGEPAARDHITVGHHDHVWARDDRYVMFCRNNGSNARLFDLEEDPDQRNDLAGRRPDLARKMYEEYVVADAGGEPPPVF